MSRNSSPKKNSITSSDEYEPPPPRAAGHLPQIRQYNSRMRIPSFHRRIWGRQGGGRTFTAKRMTVFDQAAPALDGVVFIMS